MREVGWVRCPGCARRVSVPICPAGGGIANIHECNAYIFVTREDLKRERRPHSEHWSIINEVVAWKGELRGLFEADTKRIRVVPIPEDIHLPDWAKAVVHRGKQLRLL